MLFPVLGTHISDSEFQHFDLIWKEPMGIMANIVSNSGCKKGQLSNLEKVIWLVPSDTNGLRQCCTFVVS